MMALASRAENPTSFSVLSHVSVRNIACKTSTHASVTPSAHQCVQSALMPRVTPAEAMGPTWPSLRYAVRRLISITWKVELSKIARVISKKLNRGELRNQSEFQLFRF
jgi:hypothetical protein